MRMLADRSWQLDLQDPEKSLTTNDLIALGYGNAMAQRIVTLLEQEDVLDHYLRRGERYNCFPITRVSPGYPLRLRRKLGLDSPGVFWAKGNQELLSKPCISVVGSRDLLPQNRLFAEEAGRQAARQGYVLVSGNARGADKAAQNACLEAGGQVISIISDDFRNCQPHEQILYLSEEDFDQPFSPQRAHSRNRCIHTISDITFVCQCTHSSGGTWEGTLRNLRHQWSSVFCYDDQSDAAIQLQEMGASLIHKAQLEDFSSLPIPNTSLF